MILQILCALIAIAAGVIAGALVNWLADTLPARLPFARPAYLDGSPRLPIAWSAIGARLSGHWRSPAAVELSTELPIEPATAPSALKWRALAVEIGLAALFGYLAAVHPISLQLIFWLIDAAILMLITVIDLEHRLVLLSIIFPGWIIALIGGAVAGEVAFRDYLIGGMAGFLFFFVLYLGGLGFSAIIGAARGESLTEVAFGYGDVLLATLAGFLLGWQALIFAIIITILAGAAGALIFLLARMLIKGRYEMFTALPYGQYIVLGTVIMLYWRDPIRVLLQGR